MGNRMNFVETPAAAMVIILNALIWCFMLVLIIKWLNEPVRILG